MHYMYNVGSARKKFDIWTRSPHSQNSHEGYSILIHWSTQIRYFELNWFKINVDLFRVLYLIEGIKY